MKFYLYPLLLSAPCLIHLLILLGLLLASVCPAQTVGPRRLIAFGPAAGLTNDTLYLDIDQDIAVQLLPFEELMTVAVRHSPSARYQTEVSNSLRSSYEISKVQILQNAAGYANYSGGTQTILATGGSPRSGETIGQIANGYRVGVDLRG